MTKKQKEFIEQIKPGSILTYVKYNVLPSLTLAQAVLESNWGTSELAINANNLFGIKWSKDCGFDYYLKKTKEYVNNKWITVEAYFRKYKDINESIEDYGVFLTKPRYAKVLTSKDYKEAANEVWRAGYATDPNYPSKLCSLIEKYKFYEVDDMVTSWEYKIGCEAIDELYKKGFINNPDYWKVKDLKNEATPLWLFFEMQRRFLK